MFGHQKRDLFKSGTIYTRDGKRDNNKYSDFLTYKNIQNASFHVFL